MDILSEKKTMKIADKIFNLTQPLVMGVINLTPDSFYDGGIYQSTDDVLQKVEKMIAEGASIIDIGGCSTRPGAEIVEENEELNRVIIPIKEIRNAFPSVIISIDTVRANVAQKALESGANMINDISAGNFDKNMPLLLADSKVPYVLMHSSAMPADMQQKTDYDDVVKSLLRFFQDKIDTLTRMGVSDIIIDPGFGFGKTLNQNYELLKNLNLFNMFGLPILVGMSRKSMIYKQLDIKPVDALNGSTVLNTLALLNGADILRVHDVKEAVETIKLVNLYQNISGTNI